MARVKGLNFLLEFGQKNLQSAMVSTDERYRKHLRKQLLSLIYDNFPDSTPGPELTELRRYQSGLREVIVELKKIKEGTATFEGVKFEVLNKYEISGPSPRVNCTQNISLKDKELMGKLLIWKELVKAHTWLADAFDYCKVCGNIYAIVSEKSKFCSYLCRTKYQKQKAG